MVVKKIPTLCIVIMLLLAGCAGSSSSEPEADPSGNSDGTTIEQEFDESEISGGSSPADSPEFNETLRLTETTIVDNSRQLSGLDSVTISFDYSMQTDEPYETGIEPEDSETIFKINGQSALIDDTSVERSERRNMQTYVWLRTTSRQSYIEDGNRIITYTNHTATRNGEPQDTLSDEIEASELQTSVGDLLLSYSTQRHPRRALLEGEYTFIETTTYNGRTVARYELSSDAPFKNPYIPNTRTEEAVARYAVDSAELLVDEEGIIHSNEWRVTAQMLESEQDRTDVVFTGEYSVTELNSTTISQPDWAK